jgi:two-component system KDP operon response regulator KdpE
MTYVLIVEPDQALARTLKQHLTQNEFKATVALTAQDGIIQADNAKPDVVVLELAMPEHNGIEFLQEFRSYADWLDVPIVVYSHIPRGDTGLSVADWQKYGVVEYLYKPTSGLRQLSMAVGSVVNSHETV